MCGKLLCNMGAQVIKVEPPGGARTRSRLPIVNGESVLFRYLNAGKQSVTLDAATGEGQEALERLLARADVLLLGGHPADLPLGQRTPERMSEAHPNLILAVVTPFGREGPYASYRSDDLVSLALGGILNTCGYDDHEIPPVRPGGGQSYNMAGVFGTTGIMLALFERSVSGRGQVVDVAVHDCISVTTENSNIWWFYLKQTLHRQTGRHATVEPTPSSQVLCGDERYLNGGAPRGSPDWEKFVDWLDSEGKAADLMDERFSDQQVRQQEGRHIREVFSAFALTHTADEMYHGGQARGYTWGAIHRPEDAINEPQLKAREFFVKADDGVIFPGSPYRFTRTPWQAAHHVPAPGEHNELLE
jgi:crotonobetainyl-CoA:carnitine CoA-transferase CaiB-like acyl-CoA transferase